VALWSSLGSADDPVPRNFGEGAPIDLPLHGAPATGMFRPIRDAWAPLADGLLIQQK
jgi:hypothetical protein